jgi:hypothetical protein
MMIDESALLPRTELWVCHLACASWSAPDIWVRYFGRVQEILGTDITHLDKNDPVRRRAKPGKLAEAADYVSTMGNREDSRRVFGRIESIGVDFAITHYREVQGWPNSITWYFPLKSLESAANIDILCRLFDWGNSVLNPFYAYADTKNYVSGKKKESGAVDIRAELLGVFWLTYLDPHYVAYLTREKLTELRPWWTPL